MTAVHKSRAGRQGSEPAQRRSPRLSDGLAGRCVGFVGLGGMGEPMASQLVAHGIDLLVWTRSADVSGRLAGRGARAAVSAAEVFARSDVILLMLANETAIDEVMGCHVDSGFTVPVRDRTIVNMGTVAPAYAAGLDARLRRHGGRYVEAPVSGSRTPALEGSLVAMLAGEDSDLDVVEELIAPLCRASYRCGRVPAAMQTKLAVNVFLIALVTGLAESIAFARSHGVDPHLLCSILDAGPMASAVSRGKLAKVLRGDRSPQASIRDVHYNTRLILDSAGRHDLRLGVLAACSDALAAAERSGRGGQEMIAVLDGVVPPAPAPADQATSSGRTAAAVE